MSEQGQVSQPLRVGRKVSNTPFPTREELMKRNSFPGPEMVVLCCLSPITPPASAAARSQPVTVSVNLSKMNPPGAY